MSNQTMTKCKTTLYLTESNKKRFEPFSRGKRTNFINQAIAEKLEELEKQEIQQKLLESLDNSIIIPSQGVSTEDALHETRT